MALEIIIKADTVAGAAEDIKSLAAALCDYKAEQVKPIEDTSSLSDVETVEVMGVRETTPQVVGVLPVPEMPKLAPNRHYGQMPDGSTYTKWDDMCKALDTAGPDRAPAILAEYSDNGTYGGVKPANWDKVIKACQDTVPAPEALAEAVKAQETTISEEELRTACTLAKNAGVKVPHYLETIAGVKRVTQVPPELRIKIKEALEAEMAGGN